MRATIPYVKEKFREFNDRYFGGELPEIPIALSNAKTFLGKCEYKRRKLPLRKEEKYDFKLRINTRIDLPEEEVEDTIIHEMIHYYIGYRQFRDTSAHGEIFRSIMASINRADGRHVTISHKLTPEQLREASGTAPKAHVVALVRLRDGREGFKVLPCTRRAMATYLRGMKASGKLDSIEFYLTADTWFNGYPSSAALKIYFTDMTELRKRLETATRL